MRIVMLGAPGAGKGTQADRISEKYRIPHISTGDIFRSNIKAGTDLGKKAKEYMDQGLLVPDEITIGMLLDRIGGEDCREGYILDGFPRTIPQAESLTDALAKRGEKIDFAINIDVPDEAIIGRMSGRRACLKCGATYHIVSMPPKKEGICDRCGEKLVIRDDDKPETVQKRLKVYHEQTQPLIEYYEKQGVLRTVDGTQPLERVFADITALLG
ncbi:adenylate kinase [Clostridium vitabionis]|uniref:adenylate kinase n=1 Tax=Clostridium vitabionis TaxID=2784388 RepID=UPI00188C4F4F|nr:adenylate kinase [Clostridium vitabionis]